MSEQEQVRKVIRRATDEVEQVEAVVRPVDEGFDAFLDEIDEVLSGTSADYVRSFVQKGGQ
ncbi:MAG TPA: ubiquitin-like protein Pup [Propionibacteriaceae bacterium]|nr:ubiquitin-like protein Pup [Propionibacteriaceae bacterium]